MAETTRDLHGSNSPKQPRRDRVCKTPDMPKARQPKQPRAQLGVQKPKDSAAADTLVRLPASVGSTAAATSYRG
jgi:hypothetical protein